MLVRVLARTPGTTLHRDMVGDDWSLPDHLLAQILDALAVANWQRSKDGTKASRRPKPVSPLAKQRGEQIGDPGERTPEQTVTVLSMYRAGSFDAGR